jgi:hypothetical protein
MNLAFGALLLFLLLFPGILLRISYLNGPYSRKNIQSSLVDELILSLIPALILQAIGYWVVRNWSAYDIRLEVLYQLIVGVSNPQYKPDFDLIDRSLGPFLGYHFLLFVIAVLAGKAARWLVKRFDFDVRFHSLRFNNDWYYLLSGRLLDFPGRPGRASAVSLIFVDALVETKEGSYLYCGLLEEFYLSKDGLDRMCLSQVYRRKLSDDAPGTNAPDPNEPLDEESPTGKAFDQRYYEMPGDLFVIPYAQIRNLNLSYFSV